MSTKSDILSGEPLTLSPAFLYIECEKEKALRNTLCGVIDLIDSILLDKFHSPKEEITSQYVQALRDARKGVEERLQGANKWQQDERERYAVHEYLCNFRTEKVESDVDRMASMFDKVNYLKNL